MVIRPTEREINRFGNATWADGDALARAGCFRDDGLPFGYFNNRLMRFHSDSPRVTIGGAGSGKLRDILGYVLCLPCQMPMAILDPRGELWDISVGTLAAQGIFGYSWDPYQVGDVSHSINPLDHLKPNNRTLFPEVVHLARTLLPLSKSANGKYFELTAQNILIALILHEVRTKGGINFPRLYELIHMIESDLERWADVVESMLDSDMQFLRTAATVLMIRQQDTPKEFGAVMGEIYAYTIWLSDEHVRNSLKGGDASLQEMVNPSLNGGHIPRFHFKVPAAFLDQCGSILRVFFDTIMILKERHRGSRQILLLIDEAAQLQKFDSLQSAFTYGRGSGAVCWAIFQSTSQIEEHYGRAGVQTFLSSAAMRQFFGVRDITTANVVSQMCGYETLEYDDYGQQADADHHMMGQINALLDGADPFETAQHMVHFQDASVRKSKVRRELIAPSEVLGMAEDEAITFLSGKNLPPIFHNKYPYYERLDAGQFYPNPHHPPINQIQVSGFWGKKILPVRRISVPANMRHFPQYQSGSMLVVGS